MSDNNLKSYKKLIEDRLESILPPAGRTPKILHKAMRYSVLSGGKRLRPLIVLVSGGIFGVSEEELLPVACGIELIHNFSLIHDDLPAMDNDDFRRGRPTCHREFNEPIAILAGDALLTLGFEVIAESGNPALIKATAEAIGSEGMAGGQALDIAFKNKTPSDGMKRTLDEKKTGRLFHLCFTVPFFFKKAGKNERIRMESIAKNFGVAFQMRDDIEDNEGNAGDLKRKLDVIAEKMKEDIAYFGSRGKLLSEIAGKLYGC